MKHFLFTGLVALFLGTGSATAVDSVVVFHELQYQPRPQDTAGEWVELHNQMAIDIDLSGWHLEDGINFTFPEGTILRGGGFLLIAANPPALQASTGATGVLGPFTGSLSDAGEQIQLRDRNERLMDEMVYSCLPPWPIAPGGSGATLAKRIQDSTSGEPDHWASSVSVGGTPGAPNFPKGLVSSKQTLIPWDASWKYFGNGDAPAATWNQPGFDDSAWTGGNSAGLTAWWPLNGNATAITGANGTLTGGVTPAVDRSGVIDGALAFGGTPQQMTVPAGGGLDGATAGTISLWARWNATFQDGDSSGTYGAILGRQKSGGFSNNILALSTSNPATARLVWKQNSGAALITGSSIVGTNWRHIAVTFSPTGSTLYLDGVAQGTATGTALSADPSVPLSIGAWDGTGDGYLKGALDDVAIWNQPLDAAQIAALAASTKTPGDFGPASNAIYFSGNGSLLPDNSQRRTFLPSSNAPWYFRREFSFAAAPGQTTLQLGHAVDDGAVFYLNGLPLHRHNLPEGALNQDTLALNPVGAVALVESIPVPAGALQSGSNILAVAVHPASTPDSGMIFGATLSATIQPAGAEAALTDELVLNEVSGTAEGTLQIELIHRGTAALNTAGYVLRKTGSGAATEFPIPARNLAPGELLVMQPSVPAAPGDKLFLIRPSGTAVADAVVLKEQLQGRAPGRGEGWFTPEAPTPGAPNTFRFQQDIVINEVMYAAPPVLEQPAANGNPAVPFAEDPEQWVELHNRGSQPVSLNGWKLEDGISYLFPVGTVLPAKGYLVIANQPASLQAKFPGLAVLGPFAGRLSARGENVLLTDAVGNPADAVHYYDDGRWPEQADKGGSSLELRDPRADRNAGENWAASDESARSSWKTYSYQGTAAASGLGPDSQWKEFVLGLLDKGEVLLDDLSVTEAPDTAPVELLQNGSFSVDAAKWRILGNHRGSVVVDPDQPGNQVLRLVSDGSTDHMSNHAETTFAGGRSVVNGRVYRISFRAKWISGCRQLNTRLYFNRLARTTILDGRPRYGTPGTINTAYTENLGPTYQKLLHQPAVPAVQEPVTVSVSAADPDGLAALTLWFRPDGGTWSNVPMSEGSGSPGRYSAVIPGQTAGRIMQFYVEGADAAGVKAQFPAGGPDSRALYKVNDGLAKTNGLQNFRLILPAAEASAMHNTLNLMSNQRRGATIIYKESEIFYNAGLRLKGSEHSRTEPLRLGFNVGFTSEQLFRGVHRSVAIDRSESTGYGQREMLMHQVVNHCGGVPTKYNDLIQVIAPLNTHTGGAELQLARYTDVFLEDQYEDGSAGMVYEYELIYQLNSTNNGTPEGIKVPAADTVVGTSIGNLGNTRDDYRWAFLIKNNEDRDDYSRLIPWAKWMATSGTVFTSQIPNFIDPSQWLRGTAINVLSGAGDSYGGDGSQHNVQFYVRPGDGKVLFFPHDLDAFLESGRGIEPNSSITKMLTVPQYARMYYGHLLDIMETTYNTTYMTRWANHFGALLPAQPFASHLSFIGARKNSVTTAINNRVPPATPFALTTNGGADVTTDQNILTLAGTANMAVRSIQVNGVVYPITWSLVSGRPTGWTLSIPLQNGLNSLTIQGLDRLGNPVAAATDTLQVTSTGSGSLLPVRINEWMADNAGPTGYPDPADGKFQDWIELYNPNAIAVNLAGFGLTDDLAQPFKAVFPQGSVIGPLGFLLIWADNEPLQTTQVSLHVPFQLSNNGESLGLYNVAGVAQHTLNFGAPIPNTSQGYFPDGDPALLQTFTDWTPRYPNTLTPPMAVTGSSFGPTGFQLQWTTLPGRTYRIEVSPNPVNGWTPLTPDIPASGPSASFVDPAPTGSSRYYRIRRLE